MFVVFMLLVVIARYLFHTKMSMIIFQTFEYVCKSKRKSDAKRFYIANKLGTMTAYIYKKLYI